MFALLLHESMDPFYRNIASFPTALFTVLLAVCLIYWLCAVLGFVDIEFLDIDTPEGEIGDSSGDSNGPNVLAGLLLRLGLNGVPVTIIISIIALFGWTICYFAVHFIFPFVAQGLLRYVIGLPIFVAALYVATLITSVLIRPLRPLFISATQNTTVHILGQTAVVRTGYVDNVFGEANLEDGGAGLVLKVRTIDEQRFNKGDRVVLFDYNKDSNIYRVVSEQEFTDK